MTSCGQGGIKTYNKGLTLMDKGDYEKAIEAFSYGIELNDIAKSVNYYGRAYSHFELKNFNEAKSDIGKSLETETLNKENINSDIYWLKGMIAAAEGNKQLEIKSYEKAIEYAPENLWLKTTLGLALIENNESKKAIEILTTVIEKNTQDAYAFNNRALALIKVGKLEMAKSDLDESKKLDSQNPFLYKNYFLYYKEKNDLQNACQAIEEALKKDMSEYGEENDTKGLKKLKNEFCA
ncbi:MAG: TPR repeat-containing protein YrrB [Saprospiraceae bacterium]|nr:MAG: TPR repeat-containing protein YrrB [Saprospiraceae bacterium]